MQEQNWNNSEKDTDQEFNIRQQIERYLTNWKWFLISALVFLTLGYLYLRYSTPIYNISATVLIKDDRKGGLASELGSFSEIASLSGVKSNVDNELEVLKSRSLVEKTVRDLNLNISYFADGRVITSELYKNSPIKAQFFDKSEFFEEKDTTFIVENYSNLQFDLTNVDGKKLGRFNYGAPIKLPFAKMIILKEPQKNNDFDKITLQLNKLERITNKYLGKLQVDAINKTSSVLKVSMLDPVKELGEDFIDKMMDNYNLDAINDKNQVAKNTEAFINLRLSSITKELDTVEGAIETFKKDNRVTDIVSEANAFLSSATTLITAVSIPRFRSMGLLPAATIFAPSRKIA